MEAFPTVKRKEVTVHGEYRARRVILKMFDQMMALPTVIVAAP